MGNKVKIDTQLLGGVRVGHIVDNPGLDSDATVQEAIDYGYVVGKKEAIKSQAEGVLKAMVRGVERDGNGRKVDGIVSIHAFATGKLDDITDEITKDKIGAVLRARMLKDFKVDVSDWSFVIEGATGTFRISVITTGEKEGEIVLGEAVKLNGIELTMHEGDTIDYLVPETGVKGSILSEAATSDPTRITLQGEALSSLKEDAANNGRDIVFTVKIGNKKAIKSAKMVIA